MKVVLVIWFLLLYSISAQINESGYYINCDSIYTAENINEQCMFVKRLSEPVKPYEDILNEFYSLADTGLCIKTIIISTLIDTLGNVTCAKIAKGNSNEADTVALNYISSLKFVPALGAKNKLEVSISIPLFAGNRKETKDFIKVNGKWKKKDK